jgi:c-di-GMP-binding flagellar brake protein YcgR
MTGNFLTFFLLQVSAKDFNFGSKKSSPAEMIGIFAVIGVIVVALVIVNLFSKKSPDGKKGTPTPSGGGSGGSHVGILSVFTFHRIAKELGLDNEQTKMLDYVFKTDQVTDPEKSIKTPELLDRHFRRAFRLLDQTQSSDSENQQKIAVLFSTRNIIENSVLEVLNSSRQIKEETTFTIIYGKDRLNLNVVSAKGDYIDVEVPKNVLGSQIKINKGTRLTVLFFSKNNKGFSFETRVIGYATKNNRSVMMLAHSNHVRFLSQRRFRRRQANLSCTMNLVIIEGSGKKQHLIADKKKFQGAITDISVGGCSIKVLTPVKAGAMFKVEFQISDMLLTALGQILRTNKIGASTIIHMKFLKVSQKSMNVINSFVYEYSNE